MDQIIRAILCILTIKTSPYAFVTIEYIAFSDKSFNLATVNISCWIVVVQ
jgi:hypothetical protein